MCPGFLLWLLPKQQTVSLSDLKQAFLTISFHPTPASPLPGGETDFANAIWRN